MNALCLIVALLTPDWSAHTYDLSPIGPAKVTLKNSLWEGEGESVTLRKSVAVDLNGDKKPEAVLLFEYWGGGQEKHDFVVVLTPKKKGWGRTALLDGGSAKDGTLHDLAASDGHVDIGHDVVAEGYPAMVAKRRYRLLPQGLKAQTTVDFFAREPAKPTPDMKARKKKARALLTKDPKKGAPAYVAIHAAENSPASLGDAAFALMKAQHPAARFALEAAAARAANAKQRGAAYYNLARHFTDMKDDGAALEAARTSLRHRPGNSATEKLANLLRAGLGVRGIDWGNRAYSADGEGTRTLVDGSYEGLLDGEFPESLDLVSVDYGDVNGDGQEEALVHTNYWGGGTGRFDTLTVYDAKGAALGEIPGGDRADGGIAGTTIKDGTVYVERMYSGINGGACCPEFVVREVWRWNGKGFAEDEQKALLDSFADANLNEDQVASTVADADKLARAGNTFAAAEMLEGVLSTEKHRAKVYSLYGFCLMKEGQHAAPVLKAGLQFAKSEEAQAAIWYNIGRAYQANLRWDKSAQADAIAAFERSLKPRPGNEPTESALAEVKAWKKK